MKSLNEFLIEEIAWTNIKKFIGDNTLIVENITKDKQYFWAVHADLYDMLIKASNPIKFAKELQKKIKNENRQKALDYFLELITKDLAIVS